MITNDFLEFFNTQPDKVAILLDKNILDRFNLFPSNCFDIIISQFNDEEKSEFIHKDSNLDIHYIIDIILSINNDNIKFEILREDFLSKDNSLKKYQRDFKYCNIIKSFHDDGILKFLYDKKLREKLNLSQNDIYGIIKDSSQDIIKHILDDQDIIRDVFESSFDYFASCIIADLKDKSTKLQYIEDYKKKYNHLRDDVILVSFEDDDKTEALLNGNYNLSTQDITHILKSYNNIDKLCKFISENKDFLKKNDIHLFSLIRNRFDTQEELANLNEFLKLDPDETERRLLYASLSDESKKLIDRRNLSDSELSALDMKISNDIENYMKIVIDYDSDLTQYKGLDSLINIWPQKLNPEERNKAIELATLCPNANVKDNFGCYSTTQEFLNSQGWIKTILQGINPKWSDVEKLAYIDYNIGKKISYNPYFDTEVENTSDERALWKIINTGFGVCNGISQVEQYILSYIGIESELVSSGTHSYLMIKEIEIPRSDGTIVKGDTLMDPTWNLTSNRFDAFPNHFCKSYEEIRKFDITKDGKDTKSHKNEELEKKTNSLIEIEESMAHKIYARIGIAKENGHFYIEDRVKESREVALNQTLSIEEKIDKQLEIVKKYHPDFVNCPNSSMDIIAGKLLNQEGMLLKKVVANRVYARDDNVNRKLLMYIWVDIGNGKETFYLADPEKSEFIKIDRQTFVEKYECYDLDLKKRKGIRPWETSKETDKDKTNIQQVADASDRKNENLQKLLEGDER